MKKINYIIAAFLAIASLSGCKTEKEILSEHHFGNKLYLNTEDASEEILVKLGMGDVARSFTIGLPMPAEKEVSGVIVADQAYVDNYRTIYGDTDVTPLPYENCYIENPELTIAEGGTVSNAATVVFTNMDDLDRDIVYVMPVVLKNVTDINVVPTKREVYYVFKGAALINVVCSFNGVRAGVEQWATPEKFQNMTTFTMEALVRQNEADHMISTVMGVEGHYLLRLGDAGLDPNQLQIASARGLTNADMHLSVKQWHHIACVFDHGLTTVYLDGVNVLSNGDGGVNAVTLNAHGGNTGEAGSIRYFWLGYSYEAGRDLKGDMAEVRIWDRCLSEEEINSSGHFYSVDPKSEGLIAYWKMDEGKGQTLKDSSPNGNDLQLSAATTWVKVSLPAAN